VKILYVEDDPITSEYIRKGLETHGHLVDVAHSGSDGVDRALTCAYDLAILDVVLPDRDGFYVLRELRRAGVVTPVLFLTARSEVHERIRGLDLGADDYLAKPFALAELVARIRVIARRHLAEPSDGVLRAADLELDLRRSVVRRGARRIDLTPRQLALLEYLMRNRGQVVSRSMILEKVWGYGFDTTSNVIDVHVNSLRRKVDRDFEPKLIHTVRSQGYVLEVRSGEAERPGGSGVEPD
jgi:two-component system copper resistance phosphate regulon response regulator CusR